MTDTVNTVVEAEIKKFDITEAAIEQMKAEFEPLTIESIEDREGYKKVHEARMKVAKIRTSVEDRRVTLKNPFLEGGRRIDMEAKRITDKLLPIENNLKAKEKIVDEELDRIKEEKRQAELKKAQARWDRLVSVGATLDIGVIQQMTDEGFEAYYLARKSDFEEKQKAEAEERELARQATAESARIAEENRLKAKALAEQEAALKIKAARLEEAEAALEPKPEPMQPVTPSVLPKEPTWEGTKYESGDRAEVQLVGNVVTIDSLTPHVFVLGVNGTRVENGTILKVCNFFKCYLNKDACMSKGDRVQIRGTLDVMQYNETHQIVIRVTSLIK